MKKLFYLVVLLCAMGCSQSKEDKIETAFKEYANTHFDEPASFKEIVSIDSLDTISTLDLKRTAKDRFLLFQEKYSVYCDSTNKLIGGYLKDKRNWQILKSLFKSNMIKERFKEHVELLELYAEVLDEGLSIPVAEEKLNSIMSLKDTVFFQQKLSYRITTKKGPKLKTCYLCSDTLYNNISFREEKVKTNEIDIAVQIIKFEETFGPLFKVLELIANNNKELLSFLKE